MRNKIDVKKVLQNANIKTEADRSLGLFDLSILGIGAMIGTGILVLTGIVAATTAGPAVIFFIFNRSYRQWPYWSLLF